MGPVEDPARGVVAVDRAKAPPSLVQVPVDGVLGEAKLAGDLLGAHVAIDEAKAFALTFREAVEAFDLIRKGRVALVHRGGTLCERSASTSRRNIKPWLLTLRQIAAGEFRRHFPEVDAAFGGMTVDLG